MAIIYKDEPSASGIDFSDGDSVRAALQALPEEAPVADSTMSMAEFANNNAADLEARAEYFAENETLLEKAAGFNLQDPDSYISQGLKIATGRDKTADKQIAKFRQADWGVFNNFGSASVLEDAPEEIKAGERRLMAAWENTKPEGFWENADALHENLGGFFGDPLTALSFLWGGPAINMSAKASLAAEKGIRKTVLNTLASQGSKAMALKVGGAGAAWSGLADAGTQRRAMAADAQKEWDGTRTGVAVTLGAGIGGVAGAALPKAAAYFAQRGSKYNSILESKLDDKTLNSSVDETQVARDMANETGEPLQLDLTLDEVENVDAPFKDDIEELLTGLAPNENKAKEQARFNANRSREATKEANRIEAEDKRYGGFVTDSQIDQIVEQYDIKRLDLENIIADYEATRDFPNIDDLDDNLIEEVGEAFYNLNAPKQRKEFAIAAFRNYMDTRKKSSTPPPENVIKSIDALTILAQEADRAEIPELILTQAKAFSNKIGGGKATEEEVADTLVQVQQGLISPDTARAALLKKTQRFHGVVAFGRATKVLTKFNNDSSVSKDLAETIRYDANVTYTSDVKQVGMDFNETWKDYAGTLYAPLISALKKARVTSGFGGAKDIVNKELKNALLGNKSKSPEINEAASAIRKNVLDEVIRRNEELGITTETLDANYFPRLWDRSALMKDFYGTSYPGSLARRQTKEGQGANKFAKLLVKDGEAKDLVEAGNIIKNMLSKNVTSPGGSSHVAGNSFFVGRKFDKIKNDADYEDFLDNNIENVLFQYITQSANSHTKKKVFGVDRLSSNNPDEVTFETKFIEPIRKQVNESQNNPNAFTAKDAEDIRGLYKSLTGEGLEDWGPKGQFVRDLGVTAIRTSTLPLAVVSSIQEIFLNIRTAGVGGTAKGFVQAMGQGVEQTANNIKRALGEQGLTDTEIVSEMKESFMFLENASVSSADRLGDSSIAGKGFKSINRGFFKITLLDDWTKLVQLASYNIGKSLVHKNLTAIKNNGTLGDSKRIKMMRNQLAELNIDIDEGIAYLNRNNGEVNSKDPFYKGIKRAASRYTRGIVLDTDPRSAIKPTWMSDPKRAILGELMGYPTAFTNKPIKDFIRGFSNPVGDPTTFINTASATTLMLTTAMFLNNARNPNAKVDKDYPDLVFDAAARVGALGVIGDVTKRGIETYDRSRGNLVTTALTLIGPIGSDISRTSYSSLSSIIGSRMPFYGAYPLIMGEGRKKDYDEWWKNLGVDGPRGSFEKGGEVEVAQAGKEPDERIDKMTGRPYDSQAGGAYIDEEDRPERKQFVIGGVAKAISPFVTAMTKNILGSAKTNNLKVSKDSAEKVSLKMEESYGQRDPDIEAELSDPDFQEAMFVMTRNIMNEKNDLSVTDLQEDYPSFKDYTDDVEGAGAAYGAERYTPEQMSDYDREGELDELFMAGNGGGLLDVRHDISYLLDTVGATQPDSKWETKFASYHDTLQKIAGPENVEVSANEMIKSFEPDERRLVRKIFNKMPMSAMPNNRPIDYSVNKKTRNKNKETYIALSKEKELQYRAVSSGFFNEFEEAFGMPSETGMHIGSKFHAERMSLLTRSETDPDFDDFDFEVSTARKTSNRLAKPAGPKDDVKPMAMMRGYIQVKNPLELDIDEFSQTSNAINLFDNKKVMEEITAAVLEQSTDLNASKWIASKNNLLAKVQDFELWQNDRILRDRERQDPDFALGTKLDQKENFIERLKKAELNLLFRSMIEAQGFDSIKYTNITDTPAAARNQPKGSDNPFSYILFNPGQFKTEGAIEFDPKDVRHNFEDGGRVLKALKEGVA